MTKSLLTSTLLASVLALTACSKMHATGDEVLSGDQSEQTSGIVGGSAVAATEDIAKITVQIFTLQTTVDQNGQVKVAGIAGCTGSLLANNIVLTAAHCTAANPNYIFLYFSSKSADLKTLSLKDPLVRRVVGGKVGSAWPKLTQNQQSDWGDIALLRFEGGLPEGYQLAQLLPKEQELKAQQTVTLAGFGLTDGVHNVQTDKLLKVDIPIADPNYSRSEMLVDSGNGKGPCHGDSGGPAYVTINGQHYVAGTTSRADSKTDPLGQCIGDTVYTKVQPYLTWIANSMKALQSPTFKPAAIPQPRGG
ncbi:MAG: trypsin-like serine protease [Bdellovibrionales bacterium]|nr:trypsin-like serine protease [Bdellovibrionales bacterium]